LVSSSNRGGERKGRHGKKKGRDTSPPPPPPPKKKKKKKGGRFPKIFWEREKKLYRAEGEGGRGTLQVNRSKKRGGGEKKESLSISRLVKEKGGGKTKFKGGRRGGEKNEPFLVL